MYVSTLLEAYIDARIGLSVADRVTVLLEAIQADFCRRGSFTQNRSHTIHPDKPCHHTHDCDASWKRLTRLRACLLAFLVRVVNVNLISCGRCSVATLFSTWPLLPRLLLLILQQHHMDDLQHGRVCSGTCDSAMAPSSGSWFRIPHMFDYTLRPHPGKDFNTCGTRCRGLSQATHQAVRQTGY